jgi:hypothetical protein
MIGLEIFESGLPEKCGIKTLGVRPSLAFVRAVSPTARSVVDISGDRPKS